MQGLIGVISGVLLTELLLRINRFKSLLNKNRWILGDILEILFTRHGQTDWNNQGKIQGKTDIELNDKGKEQANITCSLLSEQKIDLIISSPLQRALQTAKVIAKKQNVPIIIDELLRERDYGEFEGHYFSEVDFSGIWYSGLKEPDGIEPLSDFCERIKTAFIKI